MAREVHELSTNSEEEKETDEISSNVKLWFGDEYCAANYT